MPNTIFFSWQADTPNKCGRTFLKDVLEDVCATIAADTELNEALRDLEVDTDTKGVAGQPPIADTIFKKIDSAGVFVADMTFAGKRPDGRPTPNPNVLIEYGWALKSLSHQRVICIMNSAFGAPNSQSLPFDLAHLRWPMTYTLSENASPETKVAEKKKLVKALTEAVRMSLATIQSSVPQPKVSFVFPAAPAKDGPARFRAADEEIGYHDDFITTSVKVFLKSGPAIWLRVMPNKRQFPEWPNLKLKQLAVSSNGLLMPLVNPQGSYSFVRASDGAGVYLANRSNPETGRIEIEGVAFVLKTGEIWSVDTALLRHFSGNLHIATLETAFTEALDRYSMFLESLGLSRPFHWKAGLVGIKEGQLQYPAPSGRIWLEGHTGAICLTDLIEADGDIQLDQSAADALLPFFKKIFEECGREHPDYLSS